MKKIRFSFKVWVLLILLLACIVLYTCRNKSFPLHPVIDISGLQDPGDELMFIDTIAGDTLLFKTDSIIKYNKAISYLWGKYLINQSVSVYYSLIGKFQFTDTSIYLHNKNMLSISGRWIENDSPKINLEIQWMDRSTSIDSFDILLRHSNKIHFSGYTYKLVQGIPRVDIGPDIDQYIWDKNKGLISFKFLGIEYRRKF